MKKWEYIKVKVDVGTSLREYPWGHEGVSFTRPLGAEICLGWNDFGRVGWELVSLMQEGEETFGYFKREFQDKNMGTNAEIRD